MNQLNQHGQEGQEGQQPSPVDSLGVLSALGTVGSLEWDRRHSDRRGVAATEAATAAGNLREKGMLELRGATAEASAHQREVHFYGQTAEEWADGWLAGASLAQGDDELAVGWFVKSVGAVLVGLLLLEGACELLAYITNNL